MYCYISETWHHATEYTINQRLEQQNSVGKTDGHFRVQLAPSASSLPLHRDIQSSLFFFWAVGGRSNSPESQKKKNCNLRCLLTEHHEVQESLPVENVWSWQMLMLFRSQRVRCKNNSSAQRSSCVSVCNNAGKLIRHLSNQPVTFHFLTYPKKTTSWELPPGKQIPDKACLWVQTGQNCSTDGQTCFRLHLKN